MNKDWSLTIVITVSALMISFFLWSIGIYFFFLPIIFLPFLRLVKFKSQRLKMKVCPMCKLPADGNYCSRCGTKL